ncbi:MAG: hypothetical protein AAF944_27685 [Bacteroidota bacterium]
MPANKKYLLESPWTRTSKVVAAILGGFLATASMHVALSYVFGVEVVFMTALYSVFIMWPLFMLMVYWIEKPWISWAILMGIFLVSSIGTYFGKMAIG